MSTNWQYTPVSSHNLDLGSRDKQLYSTSEVYPPQNAPDQLHQGPDDDCKPYKENNYQSFTNAVIGDVFQIPDWPGPQTLERTHTEIIMINLGYMLCLVPPLVFLGKDLIRNLIRLNKANTCTL
jgi:hypothetical protein